MSDGFKGSPEWHEWIESGGRDEDYSDYYNKWQRRTQRGGQFYTLKNTR